MLESGDGARRVCFQMGTFLPQSVSVLARCSVNAAEFSTRDAFQKLALKVSVFNSLIDLECLGFLCLRAIS